MSHILTSIFFPLLQKIIPSLTINKDLKKLKDLNWQSTGDDSQFILKSPFLKVLSGWVSVRVKIDSKDYITPKIYFDFGEGYSELRAITLNQIDESTYQADIMLPQIPNNIRFDPTDNLSTFKILSFTIKAHSETLHFFHQFISIIKHDNKNDIDTLRIIKKSYARYKKNGLNGMMEKLDKEYIRIHPFRQQKSSSEHTSYLNWIKENEDNSNDLFNKDLFNYTPLISIIMPTYNTPMQYLKKAIDSVIDQSYPYWEICIADDASSNMETINTLKEYINEYDNINVHFREVNGNISLASNSALDLAKGEYIAFLDHDDMLAPNALFEIIKVINAKKDVKFIYSDEDKIDEKGRRFSPHFKSSWNPDMFLSQNYISHLSVVKKCTLDKVGYFRVGYEGSQDYDLFLRITKNLNSNEIFHIEKILYHWRAIEGSTALSSKEKSYTTDAGIKALKNYFSDNKKSVKIEKGLLDNTYKVSYLLSHEPLVSLIIPTRDEHDILSLCIQSILEKTMYKNYEILIVDNQTTCSKTLKYFDELTHAYKNIKILKYNKEFNYSAINNYAVEEANGEIIGLINNDVEVISNNWLTEMVQHALRPCIGAVGAKLYYDNNTIQHAGVILGIGGVAGHSHKYFIRDSNGYFSRLKIVQNYSAVTGACLVVEKKLYEEVNGLDENNLKVAFNDVDFCLKLLDKGYKNLWTPYVELYHHESISRGAEDNPKKIKRFNKEVTYMKNRWLKYIKADNLYNHNLTNKHENFGLNLNE
ncbi:MAG: glycosyltransferase [Campylobacterota bacterium]|nr:glycosyltransferase [Campylobacterota bacterium]